MFLKYFSTIRGRLYILPFLVVIGMGFMLLVQVYNGKIVNHSIEKTILTHHMKDASTRVFEAMNHVHFGLLEATNLFEQDFRADKIVIVEKNLDFIINNYEKAYSTPEMKQKFDLKIENYKTEIATLVKILKGSPRVNKPIIFDRMDAAKNELNAFLVDYIDNITQQLAQSDKELLENNSSSMYKIMGVAALLLAALIPSIVLVLKSVETPITALRKHMTGMSEGNLENEVPYAKSATEFGEIAFALQQFQSGLLAHQRSLEVNQRSQRERLQRQANLENLLRHFEVNTEKLIKNVSSELGSFKETLNLLEEDSQVEKYSSSTISEEAVSATKRVQDISEAVSGLSELAQLASQKIQTSCQMSSRTAEQARKTDEIVGQLAKSSQEIGEIVNLINAIAGQTNLLALNATIEAARAGEAGRGFAVVASEVKNLAGQTEKATGEIARQINNIQSETGRVIDALGTIVNMIREIEALSVEVSDAVSAQQETIQFVDTNMASATEQLTKSNQSDVHHVVHSTSKTVVNLSKVSETLSNETRSLTREIAAFVSQARLA
jgi:methyl-accepting chemotaxis protein